MNSVLDLIADSHLVVRHFGRWPNFHDAEILSIHLNRTGPSHVFIHTFNVTSKVSEAGYFITEDHAIVSFWIEQITALHLGDFNGQNVISCLEISKDDEDAVRLELGGCYGIQGSISARSIRVSLAPGVPADGVYAQSGNPK